MHYKLLGRSGLRVSELALGTMTFGTEAGWGADKDESRRIFDTYVEAGGNFIDTANEIHTGGTSERFVGEFIASMRDYIVLGIEYTDAVPGKRLDAAEFVARSGATWRLPSKSVRLREKSAPRHRRLLSHGCAPGE